MKLIFLKHKLQTVLHMLSFCLTVCCLLQVITFKRIHVEFSTANIRLQGNVVRGLYCPSYNSPCHVPLVTVSTAFYTFTAKYFRYQIFLHAMMESYPALSVMVFPCLPSLPTFPLLMPYLITNGIGVM